MFNLSPTTQIQAGLADVAQTYHYPSSTFPASDLSFKQVLWNPEKCINGLIPLLKPVCHVSHLFTRSHILLNAKTSKLVADLANNIHIPTKSRFYELTPFFVPNILLVPTSLSRLCASTGSGTVANFPSLPHQESSEALRI